MKKLTTTLLGAFVLIGAVSIEAAERIKIDGYAEYHKGSALIVEGQRLVADGRTKFKGKGIRSLQTIPLGYEVAARGTRLRDGSIAVDRVEAKPNGMALFEADVLKATDQIEQIWVEEGRMFSVSQDGQKQEIGRILDSGPEVNRVRNIMRRLAPPYIDPGDLRVRVVDTKEWNASAMGNGAIWVYSGLIREMSDDELAIILGHELAHYSYEHSRKGAKKRMWGQLAAMAGLLGAEAAGSGAAADAVTLGSLLSVTAWQSGYSREMEDQADRVGLRYAAESGFDVHQGPRLWERFREKYGEADQVSNFFFGSHSRPSDRIRNLEREMRINYPRN